MNVTAFLAAILTSAPVCGLRPTLAALLETANVPNPTSGTLSPLTNASVIVAIVASTALPASALVIPAFAATASINSTFFFFTSYILYKRHMLTYIRYHLFSLKSIVLSKKNDFILLILLFYF